MDALPDAFLLPALQVPVRGGIVAVLLWQIAPGAAGTEHIEDGVYGTTVVGTRATRTFSRRKQGLEDGPLCVGEVSHAPDATRSGF